MAHTTIAIRKDLKDKISTFGNKGESYSEIIERIYEVAIKTQIKELLMVLGFTPCFFPERSYYHKRDKFYSRYRVALSGKDNLSKFLQLIGFRNPKHLTKIEIWNKFGFYPPRLSYQQRLDILKGKLDPKKFY